MTTPLEMRRQRALRASTTWERRTFRLAAYELRAGRTPQTVRFEGYATTFDDPYDVYGGPAAYGWSETIDPAACDRTLRDGCDTVFLINHDGLPLARTARPGITGTLELAADSTGLHVGSDLLIADPDVQRIQPKMERMDLDEMSIGFRTLHNTWSPDYMARRITELSLHRGDVSIVTFGANDHTTGMLRADSLADELRAGTLPDDLVAELEAALAARRSATTTAPPPAPTGGMSPELVAAIATAVRRPSRAA